MMDWPDLPLHDWKPTRDAIHHAARVMSALRAANTPPHRAGWHTTLQVAPTGLRTGPVPSGGDGQPFEIEFDLGACTFGVECDEELEYLDLDEQIYDVDALTRWATAQIELGGGKVQPDTSALNGGFELDIDEDDAERFVAVLNVAYTVLQELAHTIPDGFCTPVQLWPGPFAVATTWYRGEHTMTFGFDTGDEHLAEPYFFVHPHPVPDDLTDAALPHGAAWQTEPFPGVAWPYATARSLKHPHGAALKVLRAAQQAGAERGR